MNISTLSAILLAGGVALLGSGCSLEPAVGTSTPATARPDASTAELRAAPQPLAMRYRDLASGGGRVYAFAPADSQVRILAFRGGRAGRLGHNHVLTAPRFEARLYLPPGGVADARFDLEFRLDELEVDPPAERAQLGPAFESVPGAQAIAGTREHMLGPDHLQADLFPWVRVHATRIAGELGRLAVTVVVEWHGQFRPYQVPVTVTGWPDAPRMVGSLALRQTDFGIRPYSVLNGLLAVQDEVIVEFDLSAH